MALVEGEAVRRRVWPKLGHPASAHLPALFRQQKSRNRP